MKKILFGILLLCIGCGHSEAYYQKQIDELEANERKIDAEMTKSENDLKKLKAEYNKYLSEFPACPHEIPPYKPAYGDK